MKKYYFILIFIIFLFTTIDVYALTADEIKTRDVCQNIELAIANSDQTLTNVKCFDTYEEARLELDKETNENLVILERKNNNTRIIDAKNALVYLDIGDKVTYYYSDSDVKTSISYMNHYSSYGATDGVFLELNYDNYAIKVKTNGIIGWIKDGTYQIIPLNFTGTFSYYQVTKNNIIHYYAKNIQTNYTPFGRSLGPKPAMLSEGQYFSYDGIYFYRFVKDMLLDYQNNTVENSVNYENPYYNYYMYLPHRTKSNYTSLDIDAYLKNTKGLIGTIYGKKYVAGYSQMYGSGIYFKSSERLYGSNAILMMSLATNESSLGQSSIARDKNNLFGHAAYDSSAYDSATGYLNPYQSIIGHANTYINCSYASPTDYRYYGSHVGNKASGINVKYASDPYWGEKIANYYYSFDKDNGFLDYNFYQLGLTTHTSINVRREANTTSQILYNIKYENVPLVILEEVEGSSYNGSNIWYKIVSDSNLNSSRTGSMNCSFTNYYNWDSYVYIHSSFVKKINITTNKKYNSYLNVNSGIDDNYTYQEYSNKALYEPKVGLILNDTNVYESSNLSVLTGETIKKGHFVTIFMESLDENNKVVSYLVTTDYSKNQRRWISSKDLEITTKDILKVSLKTSGDYLNVYTKPGGTVLGSIYTDTYTTIVDKEIYQNDLWLKICYGINNTYAYINKNITSDKGTLTYTTNYLNSLPEIKVSDKTMMIYDDFDPFTNIKAIDSEDGDITKNIKVVKNTVDTNQAGTYEVSYEVTDSTNQKVSKTIKVVVNNYQEGDSLFIFDELKHIKNNEFLFQGFLGVKKQDNINLVHYLLFENQQTKETYRFKLEKYEDYPYEMSSIDDDKKYDYSAGWFTGVINLSEDSIKMGDYTIYIVACNKDTSYITKTYFTNIAYKDMARRVEGVKRGFSFDVDYSYSGSPILMTIRDTLLSYDIPSTLDPMYNFFNELTIKENNLSIMGTSHNVGVSYSKNDNVKREIILENKNDFSRYSFDLGYIENGPYPVTLAVSDNKDKTKAWFKKTLSLESLKSGTYAIYIKTTVNNKSYYGELIDIAYTDFSSINTDKYTFKRIDEKRLRLELTIK